MLGGVAQNHGSIREYAVSTLEARFCRSLRAVPVHTRACSPVVHGSTPAEAAGESTRRVSTPRVPDIHRRTTRAIAPLCTAYAVHCPPIPPNYGRTHPKQFLRYVKYP
jgi:hypothetical protein